MKDAENKHNAQEHVSFWTFSRHACRVQFFLLRIVMSTSSCHLVTSVSIQFPYRPYRHAVNSPWISFPGCFCRLACSRKVGGCMLVVEFNHLSKQSLTGRRMLKICQPYFLQSIIYVFTFDSFDRSSRYEGVGTKRTREGHCAPTDWTSGFLVLPFLFILDLAPYYLVFVQST